MWKSGYERTLTLIDNIREKSCTVFFFLPLRVNNILFIYMSSKTTVLNPMLSLKFPRFSHWDLSNAFIIKLTSVIFLILSFRITPSGFHYQINISHFSDFAVPYYSKLPFWSFWNCDTIVGVHLFPWFLPSPFTL